MYREVIITKSARKDLAKLDPKSRERVLEALYKMKANPKTVDFKKLEGSPDIWRLRVGDWRIIMRITEEKLVAYALRIKHRREAYR
ncbi:MAG: type II toxin-antitoxin system RelE family toxin [Desulfocucumaceae bacterium]